MIKSLELIENMKNMRLSEFEKIVEPLLKSAGISTDIIYQISPIEVVNILISCGKIEKPTA